MLEPRSHPGRRPTVTLAGLALASRSAPALTFVFAVAAIAVLTQLFALGTGVGGFDFRGTLWEPALAIRRGVSPYPLPVASAVESGNPFLYPPLAAVLVVPLTFLTWSVGLALWIALLVLSIAGGLCVLGVRDWRCYVLALSAPIVAPGLLFGNLALLLFLGVACAWRWRDRPAVVGIALGLTVAAKLVTWPFLLWLVLSRRWRALGWTAGAAFLGVLLPWALIGFRGLADYPKLLRVANSVYGPPGFSLAASADALGTGSLRSVACVTAALVVLSVSVALRRRGEFTVFGLAALASVFASPIAWPYSFVLLLVPLAVADSRLSLSWVALPVLFIAASAIPHPTTPSLACCRPAGTPAAVWDFNHLAPSLWRPLGFAAASVIVVGLAAWRTRRGAGRCRV